MTNKKATGANCGVVKPFDLLEGNQKAFSVSDYAEKQANLQSDLLTVMKPSPKALRLYFCFCCEKSFTPKRMNICLAVCRDCFHEATGKGKIAKRNFIEKTLNNFHKFLRRRVAV